MLAGGSPLWVPAAGRSLGMCHPREPVLSDRVPSCRPVPAHSHAPPAPLASVSPGARRRVALSHPQLLDCDQELYKNFPLVISERWQQEVVETIYDTVNADTDKIEARKRAKNKQLGHEEGKTAQSPRHPRGGAFSRVPVTPTKDLGHRVLSGGDGEVPYTVFILSGLQKFSTVFPSLWSTCK